MIESIVMQMLLALPLIFGAYLSISLMKLPDLSIESAYLFGAVLATACQGLEAPPLVLGVIFFASALIGGAFVGLATGILNQCFKIPFLLAAIAINGFFHGISQIVLGNSMVSLKSEFNPLEAISLTGFQAELGMLVLIGIIAIGLFAFMQFSQLGHSFAIYGNNPVLLKHQGISTPFVVVLGLMLAYASAGLSGYLFAQSNGFVDLTMAYGTVLFAITALVLGKMIVGACRPSLLIPLAGIVIFFLIQQLLLFAGLDLKYFNAFQSLLVVGALLALNKDPLRQQAADHLGV